MRMASLVGGALALAALTALAACSSTPTPYQAAEDGYGFSEQQLESNRYRVTFAGNSATPRQTVQNYLLLRAAELTLDSGHDYFRAVDQQTDRVVEGYGGGPRVGVGVGGGGGNIGVGLSTILGGGGSYDERYTATMDIVVYDGEKPADDADAYDAQDLLTRLKPTATSPEEPSA